MELTENALDKPLWLGRDADGPRIVRRRDELLVVQTEAIRWDAADVWEPFEICLGLWQSSQSISSTACARPIDRSDLPFVTLGWHRDEGPRTWRGSGQMFANTKSIERHLHRVFPALLRRNLWGRVLWLDRDLNLLDEQTVIETQYALNDESKLRLYLGANGVAQWLLPNDPGHFSVRAAFEWNRGDSAARLLRSSDEELRAFIVEQTRQPESDTAFSLNWTLWGWNREAWEKRGIQTLLMRRDSVEDMRNFLTLVFICEPEFAHLRSDDLDWDIAPCRDATEFYGAPHLWREPLTFEYVDESLNWWNGHEFVHLRLPPFSRRLRDWAGKWFGAQSNTDLASQHRCVGNALHSATFTVTRSLDSATAHEQIEAFAQLRDFLATRVAPDELAALLKLN